MKKLISILLMAALLASAFSISAFALTGDDIAKTYDFALNVAETDSNGNIIGYTSDGKVTLDDARAVLRVSAGIEAPRDGFNYDVDADGFVSVADVKKMISIVLGIDVSVSDDEYLLSLFKQELNSVKNLRPGFTKTATTQCHSMLVTTRNAPDKDLNVTNMEFGDYTNRACDILESYLNSPAAQLIKLTKPEKYNEMVAQVSTLRKQAKEAYDLKTTTKTVNRYGSHYYHFPVNNLGNSCFLELEDIKSIECYEEGGYIIRKVTMNEDTYIGDEFPTGNEGFSERWKTISYGKVFNIPDFDEVEGSTKTSNLNKVTFKNGVIISKIDKLTGVPVSVDYSYTYVADVSELPAKEGDLEMDAVTTATNTESFVINPVTVS